MENSERMQYSFDQRCQCVVGQVSIHPLKACHIGTPNRLRWLGIRPRSGNEVYILEPILASALYEQSTYKVSQSCDFFHRNAIQYTYSPCKIMNIKALTTSIFKVFL